MIERGLAGLEAAGDEYGAAIATGNPRLRAQKKTSPAARLSEDAAGELNVWVHRHQTCRRATRLRART
jgi:hypothetical protein